MGFGTILFIGLLAGGFFLLKRFGLAGAFQALLYPAKARFTRYDDAATGAAIFDVTPARVSWTILILCVLIYLIGNWIYQADSASGHSNAIPFLIWAFIPVFGYFLLIGARHRKRVRLTVSGEAIHAGERSWPLSQIASLQVRKGSRRGEEEVGTIVTTDPETGVATGAKPTSALIGKALGGKMAARSYLLTLRSRAGSDEHVLAGGLTLECAAALHQDLLQCIQNRQ